MKDNNDNLKLMCELAKDGISSDILDRKETESNRISSDNELIYQKRIKSVLADTNISLLEKYIFSKHPYILEILDRKDSTRDHKYIAHDIMHILTSSSIFEGLSSKNLKELGSHLKKDTLFSYNVDIFINNEVKKREKIIVINELEKRNRRKKAELEITINNLKK